MTAVNKYFIGIQYIGEVNPIFIALEKIESYTRSDNKIIMISGKVYQLKEDDMLRVLSALEKVYEV
jgi:hypothetical protein